MPISFACPHCGHHTDVAEEHAGQTGPCSECGRRITVPPLQGASDHNPSSAGASPATTTPAMGATVRSEPTVSKSSGMVIALIVGAVLLAGMCVIGAGVLGFRALSSRVATLSTPVQCQANISRILLALESYHDRTGSYPPAYSVDAQGRPLHSWRVLILPDLGGREEQDLYDQIDLAKSWDSPGNSILHTEMPSVYGCPDDFGTASSYASYVVVNGTGFVFDGRKMTKRGEIVDAVSDTIMIVETYAGDINWMDPRDLEIDELEDIGFNGGFSSNHFNGSHVGVADGTVKTVSSLMDPDELRALLTINGGETVPPW